MEQLFNDLQNQIADKMGDTLFLIDEDCGNWKPWQTVKTSTL